jgi:hypothetical protein
MEVSDFHTLEHIRKQYVDDTMTWTQLVRAYAHDATVELSKLYCELNPSAPPLDGDTVSDKKGFLHSSRHVYIYRYKDMVHFGNKCIPWPVQDKSYWPWSVALTEAPRMVRDVWNLIFHQLAPNDILALGNVCRQLREFAHDERAWEHFKGLSCDWKFYRNLKTCTDPTIYIPNYLRICCVPPNYGDGKVIRIIDASGDTVYRIGDIILRKGYKKRNYFFAYLNYISQRSTESNLIIYERLLLFLKNCNDYKTYASRYSPIRGWTPFIPSIP